MAAAAESRIPSRRRAKFQSSRCDILAFYIPCMISFTVIKFGGANMFFRGPAVSLFVAVALSASPAASQQTIEAKVQTIKDALVTLCLAGGSETSVSAKGDVELRAKIKDILTGNIGGSVGAGTQFSKQTWEGIIGGISKEMTAVQSQQANEARKCMVDNGFVLISKVLEKQ